MKEWGQRLSELKAQISELEGTLTQHRITATIQTEALQQARAKIVQLLDGEGNARQAFFELPSLLQTLNTQHMIWAVLMAPDGTVLLQHTSGSRLLGIDPATNRLSEGTFFDGVTRTILSELDLPWHACLSGEPAPTTKHLVMRDVKTAQEWHVEVSVIPLVDGDKISGAVVLYRDMTESLKADEHIHKLCGNLQQHVHMAEAALQELKTVSEKLGIDGPGMLGDSGSQQAAAMAPPAPPVPAAVQAQAAQALEPAKEEPSANKVLIVDDMSVNQKLLALQLKKFGVEADIADNGAIAAERCKTNNYALVLMDLDMPVLNGFEATAEIRKIDQTTGFHTNIVALTALDRDGDREKCFREGMDDYLPKGAGKERLRQIVDQYVFGKEIPTPADLPPPGPMLPDGMPKLDLDWLWDTFGDDINKVLTNFFGTTTTLINCLEFAISDRDPQAVTHFAFSLKGPCSTLGLTAIAKAARDLSEDADNGRWDEATDKCGNMKKMFLNVQQQAGPLGQAPFTVQPGAGR